MTNEIVVLDGIKIRIDPSWSDVMKQAFREGNYEVAERKMLSCVKDTDIVMELGTGIGFLACYLCKHQKPKEIHTYEINPDLQPFIQDTMARNGGVFQVYNYTLGWEPGVLKYHPHKDFWATSVEYMAGSSNEQRYANVISFYEECEIIKPTVLIIDTEGCEFDLLTRGLIPKSVTKLIVEMHSHILKPKHIHLMKAALENQGFIIQAESRGVYSYSRASA